MHSKLSRFTEAMKEFLTELIKVVVTAIFFVLAPIILVIVGALIAGFGVAYRLPTRRNYPGWREPLRPINRHRQKKETGRTE